MILRTLLQHIAPLQGLMAQAALPSSYACTSRASTHLQQQFSASGRSASSSAQQDGASVQQSPDATYAAPSDSHTGELLDELAPSQQDMQQQRQHFTPVPIVPKHILMQLIREWEGPPPTSHDLWHKAERHYGGVFTSRRQLKQCLRRMMEEKWIAAKPPGSVAATAAAAGAQAATAAAAGAQAANQTAPAAPQSKKRKQGKRMVEPFVYVPLRLGMQVNLNSTGTPVLQAARDRADAWTEQNLPSYKQHLAAGRIPVTADNALLLEPESAMQLFRRQQEAAWEQKEAQRQKWQPERQQR